MVADTSEAIVWSLADALQGGDPAAALRGRRAADRPGRERHRNDLRARLAHARAPAAAPTCAEATEALADLEVWCRGGADYGDELALTLALRGDRR